MLTLRNNVHKSNRGFTLIELMVVIALIAIIAGFAVPQMGRLIENNRVVSTTNSVVGMLNYSRSEAIRRGALVKVTASANTLTSTLSGDGTVLRVMEPAEGGTTISNGTLDFRANGLASAAVTFTVCSGDAEGRQVGVTVGGRISTTDGGCP
ncbi:GspH/FimT family pseudopilin [Marinobacter salinexigens]|nr:GspH/FimT family pseudopilin [Marinobacter salinexigens]